MVVHRYNDADTAKLDYKSAELGRLLVTIDDLTSLTEILSTCGLNNILVEIKNGYIDSPEDLRTLTDFELTDIIVRAGDAPLERNEPMVYSPSENGVTSNQKAQVTLSLDNAHYSGVESAWPLVHTWASHLHTKRGRLMRRPRYFGYMSLEGCFTLPFLFAFLCVLILAASVIISCLVRLIFHLGEPMTDALNLAPVLVPAIALILPLHIFGRTKRPTSYAIVVPVSRSDYRKVNSILKRQLVTWALAILAISVTVAVAIMKS